MLKMIFKNILVTNQLIFICPSFATPMLLPVENPIADFHCSNAMTMITVAFCDCFSSHRGGGALLKWLYPLSSMNEHEAIELRNKNCLGWEAQAFATALQKYN